MAAFRLSGPCSILQQKIFTFGVAYKYKAPLPGKVGHKSGKVVGKAWVIPACHLLCFSTVSDISSEHPRTLSIVRGVTATLVAKRSSPTSYCAWVMWQCLNKLLLGYMINSELSTASGLNSSSAVMHKKNYLWEPLNQTAGSDGLICVRHAHCTISAVSLRAAQASPWRGVDDEQKFSLF